MTFSPLAFTPCRRGDTGEHVARLQGWLKLHGYDPGPVDGDFGPRTETALEKYQWQRHGTIIADKSLAEVAWRSLTAPLARAMAPNYGRIAPGVVRNPTLGETVAACARQWLAQSVGGGPLRELPGNSGPVVEACTLELAWRDRLPCECGHKFHGIDSACPVSTFDCAGCGCQSSRVNWRLAWCAGWVSTVLRQACESLGVDMPIKGSLSCDVLARQAEEARILWRASTEAGALVATGKELSPLTVAHLRPGDIFLVRGGPGDWTHCGVVLEVLPPIPLMTLEGRKFEGGGLRTAEGNTNKNGSRNGTELRERIRSASEVDYICWGKT